MSSDSQQRGPNYNRRSFLEAATEIRESGLDVGFLSPVFLKTTLPHSKPTEVSFIRQDGQLTTTFLGDPSFGLPYGGLSRVLLCEFITRAVRSDSPEVLIGDGISALLSSLGMSATGGSTGSIARVKDHLNRLFGLTVQTRFSGPDLGWTRGANVPLISEYFMRWKDVPYFERANSMVILSPQFSRSLAEHRVPIDKKTYRLLQRSPLAMDMYAFLTFRMFRLRSECIIPWKDLAKQFGASYTEDKHFRSELRRAEAKIRIVYPEARQRLVPQGWKLLPSPTHIPQRAHR